MINSLTIADLAVTNYPMERRIQDFPEGALTSLIYYSAKTFPENCMNMKKIGP